MKVHRWIDKFDDMGEVWTSGDVVCMAMQERYKIASHDMPPDTARAIADALIQAAFEIDGKGSTVAELTAQLEQARAEIERMKGTPDAHGIKPCPFCGCPGELHGIGAEVFVRCKCCDAHGEWVGTKDAAIRQWNRRGGE